MADGMLEVPGLGIEDFTNWKGKRSPIKVIREKCLDCCCGQRDEVKFCQVKECPLYPFRMGENPFRTKRIMTDEQKDAAVKRLAKAREQKENK